jgi:alkanesulfonate monooxygenase SsuD/methylene tetrahydromethanopterin reductase-like flavin-dependent oxidoreductase (luciferase family)
MIHFGIGPFTMQLPPDSSKTHADLYAEMLGTVKLAEELGFESAWLAEHHFQEDGICPSLLVTASAMAARTSKIKIGTSMFLLPLYRPVTVAEDVAVLDNISGGRFIFGVATGYRPNEYAGRGEERSGREKRMEEQLEIITKAWTRESFSHSGPHYEIPETSVTPKPLQKPHPPIWMGASTKAGCRRTAQWASSIVASPRHHLNEIREHFGIYRNYLKQFGKQPQHYAVIREIYVADTQEKAEAEAKDAIMYIHAGMYGKYADVRPLTDDQGRPVKGGEAATTWDTHKQRFMVGTPDHVVKEIERYQRELGMDYLIGWMDFPGTDPAKTRNSVRLFAKEVMPHFNKN